MWAGVVAESCERTAYYRARYYNSLTGRFLGRDPLGGKPIDPKTLHKYLYAGGDPVNRIDPRGRAGEEEDVEIDAEIPVAEIPSLKKWALSEALCIYGIATSIWDLTDPNGFPPRLPIDAGVAVVGCLTMD